MSSIYKLSARELAERIRQRELTCVAVATEFLNVIEQKKHLNAVIYCNREAVLQEAAEMDKEANAGQFRGPLHGVPIGIKDNIHIKGIANTSACLAFKDFIPSENAPIIDALLNAGALLIAKLNLHELSYGATSDSKAFGTVHNARNVEYSAGGSSGGTGAAVGAYMVPAGLGTDTAGSIRLPSSLNGICGLRPTVGRYSSEGITPFSHVNDTAGPMANTVDDLILLDEAITGQKYETKCESLKGVRLGVSNDFYCTGLKPDVQIAFDYAKQELIKAGAELVDVEAVKLNEFTEKCGFVVMFYATRVDLASYLEKYKIGITLQELVTKISSPDVKKLFEEKTMSAEFTQELFEDGVKIYRPQLQQAYRDLFTKYNLHALISPTTICSAPKFTEINENTINELTRNSVVQAAAGIPSLSIPITGASEQEGMPVGLQIEGIENSDHLVLNIGKLVHDLFENKNKL